MTGGIATVVIGATGYVGGELLRLIEAHPTFDLRAAVSESRGGGEITEVFPHLAGSLAGRTFASHREWAKSLDRGADVALFSAAPHGASAPLVARALEGAADRDLVARVVDCSADFRFSDGALYQSIYGSPHPAPQLLPEFHCAVPEHAAHITGSHIGHPGCFATAILLAAVPLLRSGLVEGPLFVTGITGSTGSGKTAGPGTHHPERHGNLYAYKPLRHRHAPEIETLLEVACGRSLPVSFVPHSGPFARGIHVTLQARLERGGSIETMREAFDRDYADWPFVSVVDGTPRLKDVVASNYCHIGLETTNDTVVVMSAIDNLVKGAAGGALQWMNRLWSLPETSGLKSVSPGWT